MTAPGNLLKLSPVSESLENYAALLRKTGRDAEAARMETRAKKMRTKHPEWTGSAKGIFR